MSGRTEKRSASTLRDFRHSLPMELLKAREAAMSRFRPMLREHGLTEQQWRVLRALAEFGSIDAGDLAARALLLAPSLTRILQHLQSKGLIRRETDDSDLRKSVVTLTKGGQRLFDSIAPESEAVYSEIEADFGRDRLESLYGLLSELYTALAPKRS